MKNTENIQIKGFGRVQLVNKKTGKIEADTGWQKNAITESGFDDAIVGAIGGIAASSQVTHLQLGTQTDVPASTQTTLSGEFATRQGTTPTLVGNGTMQATANWATDEATQSNVGAIGAYGTSTGGSCLNALTFATSAKTTDQELNATVQWRFS
jgi:hypothetical protein